MSHFFLTKKQFRILFSPLQVVAVEEMIKLGLNPTLVFILQNHSSQHIENPIGNTIYSKIKKNDTENRI